MKFYCINKKDSPGLAREFLKKACRNLNVEFVEIVSENFNELEFPQLKKGDMLYRVSTDKNSVAVEQFLLNEHVATFYSSDTNQKARASYLSLRGSSVAIPKTISVPSLNRKMIETYVDYLGGFPIIVKVVGSTKGVGVIKADSMPSLYSIIDYLDATKNKYILREFIDSASSARLAVLGDQVIASVEYKSRSEDFRSNSKLSSVDVRSKSYSQEIQKAAIEATRLRGLEFGGVDVMIDGDGKYYILEVNSPFGFPEVQKITGIDISEKMVQFLMKKTQD